MKKTIKCTCGAEKCKTTHADWCDSLKEEKDIKVSRQIQYYKVIEDEYGTEFYTPVYEEE
jgi:hypothetical protein